MIAERKRLFIAHRAAEQRSKPPTKTHMRNIMCTYLKNMGGYKHNQLKGKSYEEIQKLFDKTYKQVNSFVPMASDDKEKGSKKKAGGSRKKTLAKKRAGEKQSEESSKRQKMEDDAEKEELRAHLDIILGDDVAKMLDDFDRQDMLDLYRLVKERFETASLEGYDRLLWGDLITVFEPKKTYPLTQEMLSRMLNGKLEILNLTSSLGVQDPFTSTIKHRAGYQEYTIAEQDFKNLYPSDFEDLNLLLLQGWDATSIEYKHDYTIIETPRTVVFPVSNNEWKIMRFNEIYKFSDGTLTNILEALDYRVKEYKVNQFNPGMKTRFWTAKDVIRSKEFIHAIERRLKIRRIFRNLECFVGGRVQDIDYRLLQRTK
ncbi:hypothetical protein Tco_0988115 [Tanacetum coccineum]|uniref:Uncharacterized protein n=1 Tax=Tanacetum coccineum TaxID=301880 RepID=A0ABQ5EQ11_9ASTR